MTMHSTADCSTSGHSAFDVATYGLSILGWDTCVSHSGFWQNNKHYSNIQDCIKLIVGYVRYRISTFTFNGVLP